MKYLLVADSTQMDGTVFHIYDIGPSFDFMIKKRGKPFVIALLKFTVHIIT